MSKRRVAVTGLGIVASTGNDVGSFWANIKGGKSAIGRLAAIPLNTLSCHIGAEIKGFEPTEHFEKGKLALLDRFSQLALVAAREAIAESGLIIDEALSPRAATIIGSGVGGQGTLDDNYRRIYAEGAKRLHPFTIPKLMMNAAASHVTMELGLKGPAFAVASACASATHAIGQAFHMVRHGQAEVAVAGGAEACITVGTMKGWEALRIMAADTCRPFSKDRTGMVLGEGAAVFVLEPLERARARSATVHGELVGFGMSSDAGDIVQPTVEGPARAMRRALEDAGLAPEDVDHVNAHGTGTAANDVTETKALRAVFGGHADRLTVSSTKSMHGHALGGAGAIELMAMLLALRDGFVPPTANFTEPDPDCDLDYVPNQGRAQAVRAAISNSFAFGGLNAVLAAKRPEA